MCQQKMSEEASLREEKACPDCPMTKNRPEMGLERLVELSTISNGCTSEEVVNPVCPMMNIQLDRHSQELVDLSTMSHGSTHNLSCLHCLLYRQFAL